MTKVDVIDYFCMKEQEQKMHFGNNGVFISEMLVLIKEVNKRYCGNRNALVNCELEVTSSFFYNISYM